MILFDREPGEIDRETTVLEGRAQAQLPYSHADFGQAVTELVTKAEEQDIEEGVISTEFDERQLAVVSEIPEYKSGTVLPFPTSHVSETDAPEKPQAETGGTVTSLAGYRRHRKLEMGQQVVEEPAILVTVVDLQNGKLTHDTHIQAPEGTTPINRYRDLKGTVMHFTKYEFLLDPKRQDAVLYKERRYQRTLRIRKPLKHKVVHLADKAVQQGKKVDINSLLLRDRAMVRYQELMGMVQTRLDKIDSTTPHTIRAFVKHPKRHTSIL